MARRCGMGQEFPLPVTSQFFGTVPDAAWKMKKWGREWQAFDTVNATIGQGYMLSSPLQLAVMASRLATGKHVMPRLTLDTKPKGFDTIDFPAEQVEYVRQAMSDVVNGPGTAGRARLPIDGTLLAGKTGTAQVVSLSISNGKSGPWKYRDHGLFIFFAPYDNPRYAGAVVIEHGGGSGAAYPIARDVMTFMVTDADTARAILTSEGYDDTPARPGQAEEGRSGHGVQPRDGDTGFSALPASLVLPQGRQGTGLIRPRVEDAQLQPPAMDSALLVDSRNARLEHRRHCHSLRRGSRGARRDRGPRRRATRAPHAPRPRAPGGWRVTRGRA